MLVITAALFRTVTWKPSTYPTGKMTRSGQETQHVIIIDNSKVENLHRAHEPQDRGRGHAARGCNRRRHGKKIKYLFG